MSQKLICDREELSSGWELAKLQPKRDLKKKKNRVKAFLQYHEGLGC